MWVSTEKSSFEGKIITLSKDFRTPRDFNVFPSFRLQYKTLVSSGW